MSAPDLVLHRGLFTTLDRGNPTASAVAIKDGVFVAVGHDSEVMKVATRPRMWSGTIACPRLAARFAPKSFM